MNEDKAAKAKGAHAPWPRRELGCWALAALILLAVSAYIVRSEGSGINLLATSAITLSLLLALMIASRRILFASLCLGYFVATIVLISTIKRSSEKMVAHAYDLYFYFPTSDLIARLWSGHAAFLLAFVGLLLLFILSAGLSLRFETPLRRRWIASALLVPSVMISILAAGMKEERRHTQFYWDDLFLSSFYASWADIAEPFMRGQIIEAAQTTQLPLFKTDQTCAPQSKPPNIILIHEESVVPPSILPGQTYDKRLDPFFESVDGRLHRMRVETYGGASWLTEFSILTGLSTRSFGGLKSFLQTYMVQRLKDTLPQTLTACGYRTIVFYPMLKSFISAAPFFTSIGLREIMDAKDQGALTVVERDRFYFGNAMQDMAKHFASSPKPLFTFIETMATHWPYDQTYFPQESVPGGGPGSYPEMNEYLRRLWLAKTDYEEFRTQLQQRFPNERFVILHYGDHHPIATRMLLGFADSLEAEDIVPPPDSIAYQTYFAIDALNFQPAPLPQAEVSDVAYISSILLSAAGLPLPDSHVERLRLLQLCKGRYYDCPDQTAILTFQRRLIDSGVLHPR